jgi:hypothetical protein
LLENDHCPANVITRLGLFEMCRKELHKEFKETKLKSSVANFCKDEHLQKNTPLK